MRTFNYYLKHSFSCLSDQKFDVQVDDESRMVTIFAEVFDSSLISHILKFVLPDSGVIAFGDDNRQSARTSQPFALRIRIGGKYGPLFNARAVLLSIAVRTGQDLAITLELTTNTSKETE